MQRKSLIERRRADRGDARVVTIHMSERGRAVTARIIPLARRYEAVALAGFRPEEQQALKSMLARVYRNIATLEGEGAGEADKAA